LLDRFDMVLEVPRENIDTILEKEKPMSSQEIRQKSKCARDRQINRYRDISVTSNAQLSAKELQLYIQLSPEVEEFLKRAVKQLHLSPRVMHRMMKLSRTIADLADVDDITSAHMAEALQYRAKNMFVS